MSRIAPPLNAENYLDVLELQKTLKVSLEVYKKLLKKADENLTNDFLKDQSQVANLVKTRAWYVEQLVLQIWNSLGFKKKLSLVAVGGFGRGELHPYSDVDLLILTPKYSKNSKKKLRKFIQSLWDLGLDVGSSVRTAKQCFEYAQSDITIATNLMESRLIKGNKKLFHKMRKSVSTKKIWKGKDFFVAKLEEQKQRHHKFSETAYNVEPNLKEGPGGLRDIQMISWVVQRFYQAESLHELVDYDFLSEHEFIRLQKGQNFLWKVRFALHIIAKRKEDRILFDHQLKLAKVFGFHDEGEKNPAVEQFMQIYYRNAMQLERLNSLLLQLFDEKILRKKQNHEIRHLNERFKSVNSFIEINDTDLFRNTPTVWFELFLLLQKHTDIQGIRAGTLRAMRHNIKQVNDEFCNNLQIREQFLQILQQDDRVDIVLTQMNRLGILARYLPVFGRIVGRMQFDLFHIYTVDQHSLFAVRNLYNLRHENNSVKNTYEVFKQIPNHYLLYIAAMFHDIAKGRQGRHADLGAIDVAEFCQNHNINKENTELVVWLVKYHLIRSETAQKRDLSDPDVISKFSQQVGDLLKLRSLYLLTLADISATDPKLLNEFKQTLIYELFYKSQQYLTEDHSQQNTDAVRDTLRQELLKSNIDVSTIDKQFQTFPLELYQKFNLEKLLTIHLITSQQEHPIVAQLPNQKGSVEFLVYCEDFTGLYYLMVSVLEKYNFTVVDADINITSDNMALNTVQCIIDEKHDSAENTQRMINELKSYLSVKKFQEVVINKFTPSREKVFKIKPKVIIHSSDNNNRSLIEVICRDKHGLLPLIAKILKSLEISIKAAKIVKVGVRAESTYWLSFNHKALNEELLKTLQTTLIKEL